MRAEARINLILDAFVDRLREIDGDPDTYLTAPKAVKRWTPNPLKEPLPLIVVRCTRWGVNEPGTGLQHRAEAVIEATVFCKFESRVDDPDRELHRVISDVICAIENDWQVADSGVPSLAVHVIEGYQPVEGNDAALTGLAMATVGFRAYWPWTAATP